MNHWTPDRIAQFIKDWNAGMEAHALREKYGIKQTASFAGKLRDVGYEVLYRNPSRVKDRE